MAATIITTEDLQQFKTELLTEFKKLLESTPKTENKRFLKSVDVMKLLKISPGTLQNLRVNGTLPYYKIGGLIYYDAEEINEMLKQKLKNKPN